jgi:hypothetical protein
MGDPCWGILGTLSSLRAFGFFFFPPLKVNRLLSKVNLGCVGGPQDAVGGDVDRAKVRFKGVKRCVTSRACKGNVQAGCPLNRLISSALRPISIT